MNSPLEEPVLDRLTVPQGSEGPDLLNVDDALAPEGTTEPTNVRERRSSNVQLAIGDAATKLSAIAGILIQRPRPYENPQGDLPAWATASPTSLTSPRQSLFVSSSTRRAQGISSDSQEDGEDRQITGKELRRILFTSERDRRLMSGLKASVFGRQTFLSSFSVGLAIGSLLAVLVKILKDVALKLVF